MLTIDNGGLQKKPNSKIYKFLLFRKTLWFLFITKKQQLFFTIMSTKCRLWKNYVIIFFAKKIAFLHFNLVIRNKKL